MSLPLWAGDDVARIEDAQAACDNVIALVGRRRLAFPGRAAGLSDQYD